MAGLFDSKAHVYFLKNLVSLSVISSELTNGLTELEKFTSKVIWNGKDIPLKKSYRYVWVVNLRKIYLTPRAAELNQLLNVTWNN